MSDDSTKIIDAEGHIAGRLCSQISKLLLNGNRVQLTAEEETFRNAEIAQGLIDQQAAAAAQAQKATDKASGNQKMLDLGLSQAEVDAVLRSR